MAGSSKNLAAPALENSQKRCDDDVYASNLYQSLEKPGTDDSMGIISDCRRHCEVSWTAADCVSQRRHANYIPRAYLSQNKVAVVCSARSSGKKVTGTTSRRVLLHLKALI